MFGIDPRIWQAVLAGAFVAAGWLVNGWQNRREAATLRRERLRDVHRALFAEIGATLSNLESDAALDAWRDGMLLRMDAEPGFFPFVPRERGDRVFQAIVAEIHILPRGTIDPIVAFYTQLAAIEMLVEDMRGETIKTLAPDRRRLIYADYIEMKKQALAYGAHALRVIDAFAQGGKNAAEALSSPAAGRSVR